MKKLLFLLLACAVSVMAHSQAADKEKIARLLTAGNAGELSAMFISSIDLTLLETDDVYSRQQAQVILQKFFDENKPTAFDYKHEGKSKLDDYYYIGRLTTEKGGYRVTFFLKNGSGGFAIKQLRIEKNE